MALSADCHLEELFILKCPGDVLSLCTVSLSKRVCALFSQNKNKRDQLEPLSMVPRVLPKSQRERLGLSQPCGAVSHKAPLQSLCSPRVTCWGLVRSRQWAAVSTQRRPMRLPPQNPVPRLFRSSTCGRGERDTSAPRAGPRSCTHSRLQPRPCVRNTAGGNNQHTKHRWRENSNKMIALLGQGSRVL